MKYLLVLPLCLLAIGCGDTLQAVTAPSDVSSVAGVQIIPIEPEEAALPDPGAGLSCPHEPLRFAVNPRDAEHVVTIEAVPVTGAKGYEYRRYRYHADTNRYELEASTRVSSAQFSWPVPDGKYEVEGRAHLADTCGGPNEYGQWSGRYTFSLGKGGGSSSPPSAGTPIPAPAPAPAPAPSPAPAPTPTPVSPSRVAGPFCTNTVFHDKQGSATFTVNLPVGPYRLKVETYDPNHRAGYQTDQIYEFLSVFADNRFLKLTDDIPEAATSQTTWIDVDGPFSTISLFHAPDPVSGPQSVHGACVEVWTR